MGSGDRAGLEPRSAPYLLRFPSCEMQEILGLDLMGVLGFMEITQSIPGSSLCHLKSVFTEGLRVVSGLKPPGNDSWLPSLTSCVILSKSLNLSVPYSCHL